MHAQSAAILERKGNVFAILSGFLYGLLGYFGMVLLKSGLSPVNVSFWRFLVSSIFLLLVSVLVSRKIAGEKKHYIRAFINGALFYSAPSTLFFIASLYIGTGQAMVIFFSFPAFVMMLNRVLYGRRIKPYYFISFAVILSGLVMLVDVGEVSFDLWGIALSLLSAVSYALYVVFSKEVKLSALDSTLMVSLGCCCTSLILAVFTGTFLLPTHTEQWLNLLGIAVICTAVPILLMLEALKYIPTDRASLLSVLEPVFTVIFGVLLLGEALSLKAALGICLTLIGAMSVSVSWKRRVHKRKI